MPDEKLGGRCREDGCFKPAGHPDEHGIGRSEVLAHLEAMGPKDKLLPYSCPICKAAIESDHNDGCGDCARNPGLCSEHNPGYAHNDGEAGGSDG